MARIFSFLNLTRALFPKWSFFDQVAFTFELYYKPTSSQNWQKIDFVHELPWYGLVLNPTVNLSLAEFNVVEHFAQDMTNSTSLRMLKTLIETKQPHKNVAFKVVAKSPTETIDLYQGVT